MKVLNKVMMGAAALVLLAGCNSLKQVSYDDFNSKAAEAAQKEAPFTKITMKGSISYMGVSVTLNGVKLEKTEKGWEFKEGQAASELAALAIIAATAATQAEVADAKYYVGNSGFKFQSKEGYVTLWNAYGLQTSSNMNGNYSVSYSK